MKRSTSLFFPRCVSEELERFILDNGELRTLSKGSGVSKQTLLNNFIYVKNGLVFYKKRTNNYTKPKFSTIIPSGRLTDYHLILENSCTCCKGIESARDSDVLIINKAVIKNLMKTDVNLFSQFMMDAVYHTERQTALAVFLLTASPKEKLVKFLFDALTTFGNQFNSAWMEVDIKLTREEIANALHVSVIKLDLMLGELKKEQKLKRVNNKLCIHHSVFEDLSPCPLGREDATGCQSNNLLKYKQKNMISAINSVSFDE
ncbi:Crp/Fnr family transcriptional regulator [Ferrimonas sp. YFM]|uniref:Crp/Fnr family transcriptional regulator n=1 Tax=Ferrimonas sp. YFM TaxID=3028878 RepID=UPI00257403F9|nr:Crp/Fnr family transcriptional regulator [Ferrimonas sp. YFM]